jgi:surfactin synthase thioesterase subunit
MGALLAFGLAARLAPGHVVLSGRRAPSRHREERWPETDAELLAALRRMAGTDARLLAHEDLLRLALPALRADIRAVRDHRPGPAARITAPLTVLLGDDDPTTTPAEAAAWSGHTTGRSELRIFPGDHFHLRDWPRGPVQAVTDALAAATRAHTPEANVTTSPAPHRPATRRPAPAAGR